MFGIIGVCYRIAYYEFGPFSIVALIINTKTIIQPHKQFLRPRVDILHIGIVAIQRIFDIMQIIITVIFKPGYGSLFLI